MHGTNACVGSKSLVFKLFQPSPTLLTPEGGVHSRGVRDSTGAVSLIKAIPLAPVTWKNDVILSSQHTLQKGSG